MAKKPQQNPADLAKQAGKLGELRIRLLFLVGALIVYRCGTYIPVPGVDPAALANFFEQQSGNLLGMFNMFSGGALSRFGIFALGIVPYISSSIIMQMASHIVPSLQALRKEGESGRRQIVKYTRYGTVALASFQSIAAASWLQNQVGLVVNPGPAFLITACITLVTGTVFLMWLGEQITERGIGNGISMIILAGIVAGLPAAIAGTAELVRNGEMSAITAILMLLGGIAAIIFVVYMERAQRRITVNYARRQQGRKMFQAQSTHLPFKINMSGVIPPIFASSILMFPATIGGPQCGPAGVADHWREPGSWPAGLRAAVREHDYLLLLLLYGADVQLERHGGQPEESWRVPAGHPARRAHRRLYRSGPDPLDVLGFDLHCGRLSIARVGTHVLPEHAIQFWWHFVADSGCCHDGLHVANAGTCDEPSVRGHDAESQPAQLRPGRASSLIPVSTLERAHESKSIS